MFSVSGLRDLGGALVPTGLADVSVRADPSPDARLAAVLVPILTAGPDPRLVFTRRSHSMSRHAGEISFPGGLADAGEDLAAAALREADEELGLPSEAIELLGALPSVHTSVSGILIVPFVGLLDRDHSYSPNHAEIADVLEIPMSDLARVGALQEWEWEGRKFETYVYDVEGNVIWGATARIVRSLLDLMDRA